MPVHRASWEPSPCLPIGEEALSIMGGRKITGDNKYGALTERVLRKRHQHSPFTVPKHSEEAQVTDRCDCPTQTAAVMAVEDTLLAKSRQQSARGLV